MSTFLTQSDYSNLESCYARLVAYIGSFGAKHGWSSAELDAAYSDMSLSYEDSTGLGGWGRIQWTRNLGEDPDKVQVSIFLNDLAAYATSWTGKKADELAALLAQAGGTAQYEVEEDLTGSDIKIAADGVVTDAIKGATKVGEGSRNILEGVDEVVNPEDLDDVQKRNRWTLAAIVGVGAVAYFKLR